MLLQNFFMINVVLLCVIHSWEEKAFWYQNPLKYILYICICGKHISSGITTFVYKVLIKKIKVKNSLPLVQMSYISWNILSSFSFKICFHKRTSSIAVFKIEFVTEHLRLSHTHAWIDKYSDFFVLNIFCFISMSN